MVGLLVRSLLSGLLQVGAGTECHSGTLAWAELEAMWLVLTPRTRDLGHGACRQTCSLLFESSNARDGCL